MANSMKGGLSDEDVRYIIQHGKLNKMEIFVLVTRTMGWTVKQQADATIYSERQIFRYISNVRDIYDQLQAENGRALPPRPKDSETDKYLDEH